MQDEHYLDLDRPVWGAAAMGEVINRSERAVFHMISAKLIRTKKVGKIHTATVRTLLEDVTPQMPAE
jgi:hypothetical protein